jgi:poly(3-hydroxybutyrate) depolymerase
MCRMAKRNLREELRLQARPARMFAKAAPVGLLALESDGYLYVPAGYRMEHPIPLVLLLHGAGEVGPVAGFTRKSSSELLA